MQYIIIGFDRQAGTSWVLPGIWKEKIFADRECLLKNDNETFKDIYHYRVVDIAERMYTITCAECSCEVKSRREQLKKHTAWHNKLLP